ncbi:MAG: hypothetical protein C0603_12520 [Denitrovibrio sp.]|nr:MAG: hypothetical protein C0603_12520 [Denitrovibrio sp.]
MNKNVLRKAVSMTSTFSFLYLAFTGIIMYIVPPGRIAYWADWRIFGLNKEMFTETHTTISMLFLVCMVLHIWLNWKPIMNYMSNRSGKFVLFTKETLFGFVLSVIFIVGTLMMVPPFGNIVNAINDYKEDYEYTLGNPPYSHAELTNLTAFIARMNFDTELAKVALDKANIKYDMMDTLKTISRNNNKRPADIFEILKSSKIKKSTPVKEVTATSDGIDMSKYESMMGTGMGKKSVERIAESLNISVDTAIERLKKHGIEATAKDKLKDVGGVAGIVPMDVYIIIDTGLKP